MKLATHRTLEFIVGVAMIFAPAFVIVAREFNTDAPSVLVPGIFSLVIITAAVSGRREGGSPDVGGHLAFDRIITGLLLLAGAILFIAGEEVGALTCLAACVAEGLLLLTTDYARPTGDDTPLSTTPVTAEPSAD